MEWIKETLEKFSLKMVGLLGTNWIANSISLAMGVLGTFSFFMQLPKRIRPIVIQYGDVVLTVDEHNARGRQWLSLNAIELLLIITNLKNAVGVIEDMFVRVYTTDSFNPETVIYFPTKKTIDGNEFDFSSFVLNPNSEYTMKICFGQVEQTRSEKIIAIDKQYAFDIYYKIKGRMKIFKLKTIVTFNNQNIENSKITLKNINMNIQRSKYYKRLKKIYRATYDGILDYIVQDKLFELKYNLLILPKRYFLGFFETVYYFLKYVFSNVFAYFINRPLIKNFIRKVRKVKITLGNEFYREFTKKTFVKMVKIIITIINDINNGLPEEDKIGINNENTRLRLNRFGKEITIYMPGDSMILAQVIEEENTINIEYQLRKSKWCIMYWSCNKKMITIYNMALKIINYFGLYTNIKTWAGV
jgi:hypothetical protein